MPIRVSLPMGETEHRDVTAYIPHNLTDNSTFFFCADGQTLPGFAESLEEKLAPHQVGLIGVHSSSRFRGQEYVEGRESHHFARHEDFFVGAVRNWVQSHFQVQLTRQNCGTFGFSCGGAFAVSMGMRHPELFGQVIALSIAGRPVRVDKPLADGMDVSGTRIYLAAGESELGSLKKSMQRLASWICKNGGQSEFRLSPGGHEFGVWRHELLRGIEWLKSLERLRDKPA